MSIMNEIKNRNLEEKTIIASCIMSLWVHAMAMACIKAVYRGEICQVEINKRSYKYDPGGWI